MVSIEIQFVVQILTCEKFVNGTSRFDKKYIHRTFWIKGRKKHTYTEDMAATSL